MAEAAAAPIRAEAVAPCYASVKAACLRAAGLPGKPKPKKKRKDQDRAPPCAVTAAEEAAVCAVLRDVFAAVPGRKDRNWTDDRVLLVASALSRAAAETSIARLKVTKKQFFQAYMGIAWLGLVGQQEFLFKVFSASLETELRHLHDNPTTTFTSWVLERQQGVGDLLASHSWRAQIDAAMLTLEKEKMKNAIKENDPDAAEWVAACMHAYTREDSHGDMGWNKPTNTTLLEGGDIVIARDAETGFYTAQRDRQHGGTTRYVHLSDECTDLEECEALVLKGLPLDHHTISRMAKAKTALKLMGCVKARVTGALPSNTCCKHSADQIASCFEVLWCSGLCSMVLKLRPFPGDTSVANFPTPLMWLRAVLAGADVEALKAERRRHKRTDARQFFSLPPDKRFETLMWPCLRENVAYRVRIEGEVTLLGHERSEVRTYPDIFPRVRADPTVKSDHKQLVRDKAQKFAQDYETAESVGWAPCATVMRAYKAGGNWVRRRVDLDAAFEELHRSFVDHQGQPAWDDTFGGREFVVRDGGRVAVVHTYGTVRNACKMFARHRLPEPIQDAWVADLTSQSIKVLDISGSNLCIQVAPEVRAKCIAREVRYGGGRHATKTRRILYHDNACPRCKEPLSTGFYVPLEQGFLCAECVFKDIGPFDPRSPFATVKTPDRDGLHKHPPFWHQRANNRDGVFYIHHKTTSMSSMLIEEDERADKLVTPVDFSVPVTRFVFAASRKQLGSSVPVPEELDPSEATFRAAIRDSRLCHERDETVYVQVHVTPSSEKVQGVVPTQHGIFAFFVWLTLRKGAVKHSAHIAVGPNGEMNAASLRRAFSIFLAERQKCDGGLLATYDALMAELETERATQHELTEVLNDGALEWNPSCSSTSSTSSSTSSSPMLSSPASAGGDGGVVGGAACRVQTPPLFFSQGS